MQFSDVIRLARFQQLPGGQRLAVFPFLARRRGVDSHRGAFEPNHFIIALAGFAPIAVALVEHDVPDAVLADFLMPPLAGGDAEVAVRFSGLDEDILQTVLAERADVDDMTAFEHLPKGSRRKHRDFGFLAGLGQHFELIVHGPWHHHQRQRGRNRRQRNREHENGSIHRARTVAASGQRGHFVVAVEPAQGQHDTQQKRQRQQHHHEIGSLQADQHKDRIARQQAVGGFAEIPGETVAQHHRQQHQRGAEEGQPDLADQVTVDDGGHAGQRSRSGNCETRRFLVKLM